MGRFGRGAVVFGTLSALTAVAAAVFLHPNLNAWSMFNFDPQGFDQELESWLIAAAFGYTSGALTAAVCAVAFGAYAAQVAPPLSRPVVLVAGAGLALVNLAVTVPLATARVGRLWMVAEMTRHGHPFDPNPLHHDVVVLSIVVGAVAIPLWAVLGYAVGRLRRFRTAAAAVTLLALPTYVLAQSYALAVGSYPTIAMLLAGLAACAALLMRRYGRAAAVTTGP